MRPFDPEPPVELREPIRGDTRDAVYLALAREREASEERMIRELEEQDERMHGIRHGDGGDTLRAESRKLRLLPYTANLFKESVQ